MSQELVLVFTQRCFHFIDLAACYLLVSPSHFAHNFCFHIGVAAFDEPTSFSVSSALLLAFWLELAVASFFYAAAGGGVELDSLAAAC